MFSLLIFFRAYRQNQWEYILQGFHFLTPTWLYLSHPTKQDKHLRSLIAINLDRSLLYVAQLLKANILLKKWLDSYMRSTNSTLAFRWPEKMFACRFIVARDMSKKAQTTVSHNWRYAWQGTIENIVWNVVSPWHIEDHTWHFRVEPSSFLDLAIFKPKIPNRRAKWSRLKP